MGCLSGSPTEITLHRKIREHIKYECPGPWSTHGHLSIEWYHVDNKFRVIWRVWFIPSLPCSAADHRLLGASRPCQFADDATKDLWEQVEAADRGVFQARVDVMDPALYLPLLEERKK